MTINDLPIELIQEIFLFLQPNDISMAIFVSKTLYRAILSDENKFTERYFAKASLEQLSNAISKCSFLKK